MVALVLRVGFAWNWQSHFSRQALSVIPFLFESGNIAHSLATGAGFSSPFRVATGPTAWMTPLYPLLLSAVMRIFGSYTLPSWVAAVSLNISASTAACIPIFFAGRKIGGIRLAAAAAWLWAIFPNAILLSFESLWDTSLSALLGATLLWATLRVSDSRGSIAWGAYGLLCGIALMTNAALISLLPFLLCWLAYRRGLGKALIAALIALLCCLPWTIRNYSEFHSFIPLRSVLGLQLWVGNNPAAKVVWLGEHHPINDTAERNRFVAIGEVAYMREKTRDALRYMSTHPRQEAGLIWGRFVSIWSGGTPSPVRDLLNRPSAWFRYVLLFNLGAALGTLGGIFYLFRRGSPYAFPLAVYPAIYPWAFYLTLALPRYRHPIDPVLMLLTAVTLRELTGRRASVDVTSPPRLRPGTPRSETAPSPNHASVASTAGNVPA
jgi:4-amino-4-deoxy-L-arabinose transferase-like glycosyltransferase